MSTTGIFAGLAAGVAIGLLLAPEEGSKTRKRLMESWDELKEKLNNLKSTSTEELDELKEVFKHEIAGLKDDVRQRVLQLIQSSKTAKDNIREGMTAN